MRHRVWVVCLVGLLVASVQTAAAVTTSEVLVCLDRSASWAAVHPDLLRAIATVESKGDARAFNRNRNGSYDVGLMQINSSWYTRGLAPWWSALGHPCVNLAAGAWVLRQCVDHFGYTWGAVGCYHAGADWQGRGKRALAQTYIRKVQRVVVAQGIRYSRNVPLRPGGGRRDTGGRRGTDLSMNTAIHLRRTP